MGEKKKISFIGYGNMAQAIARSLANDPHYQLRVASPSLSIGIDKLGVATHNNNLAILNDADVLILAVKPAKAKEVLAQIKHAIPNDCLVISVMTGLNLLWLGEQCLSGQPIVRSMPNIATAVKKGATPLIANQFVSKEQKNSTEQLFARSGIVAWLEKENDIDIFTALSGSGPAYVFLFLEAMASAAEKLGLAKEIANNFSLETLEGAVTLAKESGLAFHQLREKVTSPGGTTAAAIQVFKERHIEQLLFDAMKAAYIKAQELGGIW